MFTIADPPKDFEELNDRCRELIELIWSKLPAAAESFKLRASTPLYEADPLKQYVYRLKDGNLSYTYRERTLFYFQEGDLIGFERELDLFKPTVSSDFATLLERYPFNDFIRFVHTDPTLTGQWQEFLGRYIAAIYAVARSLFKDSEPILPEVRSFPEGTEIISSGDPSKEVYTLADGRAKIWIDGEVCGEIESDQVFGLGGVFAGTPRKATVVAESDCLVLALPRDGFLELLMSRPDTVKRLLVDLATLVTQNRKVSPKDFHPLAL